MKTPEEILEFLKSKDQEQLERLAASSHSILVNNLGIVTGYREAIEDIKQFLTPKQHGSNN